MALITPAAAGQTARDVVTARLTRRDRDVPGIVMLILLLVAAGLTMLVLFVLLATIVNDAWPVVTNQGVDFVTGTIGSDPATIGVWPGLYGSFFIGLGVVVVSIPLGVARGDLPRGVRQPEQPADACDPRQHPQPRRRARRHLRRARLDHLRPVARADHVG